MLHKKRIQFQDMGIRAKLVIMVYSSVVVMVSVMTVVLLWLSAGYARERLIESKLDTVKQINAAVGNVQKSMYSLADYYSITPEVQRMIGDSNRGVGGAIPSAAVRAAITHADMTALVFYNRRGEPVDYMSADMSFHPQNQMDAGVARPMNRLMERSVICEWEFIDRGDAVFMQKDNTPKLCLWRTIKSTDRQEAFGAVAIAVDSTRLLANGSRPNESESEIIMLDRTGREMLHSARIRLEPQEAAGLLEQAADREGSLTVTAGGLPCYAVYQKLEGTEFITCLLTPLPSGLFMWKTQDFLIYILIALLLFVLLFFPLLIVISGMLTKPIRSLTQSMKQFSSGDFSSNVAFAHNDEIGALGKVFNTMVKENKKLIEQTYLMQIKEKDAELSALQAQINPHFLYNLINTIHWNALRKGDAEIADIAYSMGQVFRISLSRGNNSIPLQKEKELVEYYLKLQKIRYKSRLEYTIDFAADTLAVTVPKLLIQPLVENAIVHGAEDSSVTVHVTVTARRDGDWLVIAVSDNGTGIPEQILALLPDRLPPPENSAGNRFALKNISDRLKLNFGERYAFTIASRFGDGTQIQIKLPIERKEDDRCCG